MGGFSFRAGDVLRWRGCAFHQRPPPPHPLLFLSPRPVPLTRSNMWPKLGTCGSKSALLLETWCRSACGRGVCSPHTVRQSCLILFFFLIKSWGDSSLGWQSSHRCDGRAGRREDCSRVCPSNSPKGRSSDFEIIITVTFMD